MNKKNIIILGLVFLTVVLIGFISAIVLLRREPPIPSKATGISCPVNSASCSWSSDDSATSFAVEIIDQTTGEKILTTTTAEKIVYFTPIIAHSYKCIVTPVNDCGTGPEKTAETICTVELSITPTPPSTETPTPPVTSVTITPELSPSPSPTITPTPTEALTQTPTPTEEISSTPTPTSRITLTQSITSTPSEVTSIAAQTEVPPTIPASGIPATWLFILIPVAFFILGLII